MKKTGLFFDNETSSLVVFERRSNDPVQPHIAQIAARLIDLETGQVEGSMNRIVKQVGWTCHPDALAVHRITRERSMDEGVDEKAAIAEFFTFWRASSIRLAYSEPYDRRVIRTALQRFTDPLYPNGIDHPEVTPKVSKGHKPLPPTTRSLPSDWWNAGLAQCVLQLCRKHVVTPGNRSPKLTEAYEQLVGKPMEGAHDAMVDVDAMIAVYWAVCRIEGMPAPAIATV